MEKSTRTAQGALDRPLSRRAFGTFALATGLSPALGMFGSVLCTEKALANREALSALREGGHIALMRHALAPGYSDPDAFRLDDCSTQRNLSTEGRNRPDGQVRAFAKPELTPRASTPAAGAAAWKLPGCWTSGPSRP